MPYQLVLTRVLQPALFVHQARHYLNFYRGCFMGHLIETHRDGGVNHHNIFIIFGPRA